MPPKPKLKYGPVAQAEDTSLLNGNASHVNGDAPGGCDPWQIILDTYTALDRFVVAVYYDYHVRYAVSCGFGVGKVAQAAGQVLFGLIKMLDNYGIHDPRLCLTIEISFTAINAIINASTRVSPIFATNLPANAYFAEDLKVQDHKYQLLAMTPSVSGSVGKLAKDPDAPKDTPFQVYIGFEATRLNYRATGMEAVSYLTYDDIGVPVGTSFNTLQDFESYRFAFLKKIYFKGHIPKLSFSSEPLNAYTGDLYLDDPNTYIFDDKTATLYQIIAVGKAYGVVPCDFNHKGAEKFTTLLQELVAQHGDLENPQKITPLSNYGAPDTQFLRSFATVLANIESEKHFSLSTQIFYFIGNKACQLSSVFSAMTAYLSGVTLIQYLLPNLTDAELEVAGSLVALCAFVAYLNFNLPKMYGGVKAFSQGLEQFRWGCPSTAVTATLCGTSLGVAAGAGMAFFATKHSVEIFPLTRALPDNVKFAIVMTNVVNSIFPSTFGFSFSCYSLMTKLFPPENPFFINQAAAKPAASMAAATALMACLVLLDSLSNAAGSFLGVEELIETYLFKMATAVLIAALCICASNTFLNFGFAITGTNKAVGKLAKGFEAVSDCCAREDTVDDQGIRDPLLLDQTVPQGIGDVTGTPPSQLVSRGARGTGNITRADSDTASLVESVIGSTSYTTRVALNAFDT